MKQAAIALLFLAALFAEIFVTPCVQAKPFAYDDLVRLIQNHHLATIEALLPELPQDLRSNYTLVYESRSLQGATPENPRVILFGSDAKLTCAFNGSPLQLGFDLLECFQFRDSDRKFDFRQIRFPSPVNGLQKVVFSESNRSADGKISCSACHATDPRPNWDHYSTWPGAYGSEDDEIEKDIPRYENFVEKRSGHSRYRWLIQGPFSTDPYMSLPDGRIDYGHRPNLRFSEACGRMNALRDLRTLKGKVPEWQTLAFAVRALKCKLTVSQNDEILKAGLHFEQDSDLGEIFKKLNLSATAWSTQIFYDSPTYGGRPWEHQSGTGYLSQQIAMALIQDKASTGDFVFQDGINKILNYFSRKYSGRDLEFFQAVNSIVPDPDQFGGHYQENLDSVCPRLTEVFTQEYLKSKQN